MTSPIVLLTDFGNTEYIGITKGVINKIVPETMIIDLNHNINPQEILSGAWILYTSFKFFQKNSIFVCVVDPGVGTKRKALAIKTNNYYFIGPDNGLLTAVKEDNIIGILEIPISDQIYPSKNISNTFHGRDIFAPAAAYLNKNGWEWCKQNWKSLENIKLLNIYSVKDEFGQHKGKIVHIDNFGNIITNIESSCIINAKGNKKEVIIFDNNNNQVFNESLPILLNYDEGSKLKGNKFLIEGSSNTVEISISQNSAVKNLKVKIGWNISLK